MPDKSPRPRKRLRFDPSNRAKSLSDRHATEGDARPSRHRNVRHGLCSKKPSRRAAQPVDELGVGRRPCPAGYEPVDGLDVAGLVGRPVGGCKKGCDPRRPRLRGPHAVQPEGAAPDAPAADSRRPRRGLPDRPGDGPDPPSGSLTLIGEGGDKGAYGRCGTRRRVAGSGDDRGEPRPPPATGLVPQTYAAGAPETGPVPRPAYTATAGAPSPAIRRNASLVAMSSS